MPHMNNHTKQNVLHRATIFVRRCLSEQGLEEVTRGFAARQHARIQPPQRRRPGVCVSVKGGKEAYYMAKET